MVILGEGGWSHNRTLKPHVSGTHLHNQVFSSVRGQVEIGDFWRQTSGLTNVGLVAGVSQLLSQRHVILVQTIVSAQR